MDLQTMTMKIRPMNMKGLAQRKECSWIRIREETAANSSQGEVERGSDARDDSPFLRPIALRAEGTEEGR